ncbi:competence type IV pilus minor pilin ComGF [Neobacillus notoginsengisoli]|nr:competence type IV pilus minor pilin ComGF [Neobacillus notoginsengisoli]
MFIYQKKKRYARKGSESGFSMAEMLLSLSAFCIIANLLVPAIFIMGNSTNRAERVLQDMEWEVFLSQSKKELRMSSSVEVQSGKLLLKNGKDVIIYEKYGSSLRRRVNLTGHEIIIQNISSVFFFVENQTVIIRIIDLKGKEYEGSIHSFVSWERS